MLCIDCLVKAKNLILNYSSAVLMFSTARAIGGFFLSEDISTYISLWGHKDCFQAEKTKQKLL